MANTGYTELVCIGDRLVAARTGFKGYDFGTRISGYDVVSNTHARCKQTGKMFKLNYRGNNARLFIGNAKVLGRV
jgi:hypothetical protein